MKTHKEFSIDQILNDSFSGYENTIFITSHCASDLPKLKKKITISQF